MCKNVPAVSNNLVCPTLSNGKQDNYVALAHSLLLSTIMPMRARSGAPENMGATLAQSMKLFRWRAPALRSDGASESPATTSRGTSCSRELVKLRSTSHGPLDTLSAQNQARQAHAQPVLQRVPTCNSASFQVRHADLPCSDLHFAMTTRCVSQSRRRQKRSPSCAKRVNMLKVVGFQGGWHPHKCTWPQ